jgi:pimeloyl-ACP methyl ester carboxylesterase
MKALIVVAAFVALAAIRFSLPAGTPRIRRRGKAGSSKSIATLEKVSLGGSDQWVLQRSEDIANPVILFLHGGPGTAQLTLNRRPTHELEQFFTVVNWDQRGAGKSYRAIKEVDKMNIDQFVADVRELTLYLLKKFGKERLVLAGHSWGSVIGVLAAARYPELYSCYVGIGQLVNMEEGETASYRWTLEQAHQRRDRRVIKALEQMGPPPYSGNWQAKTITQRKYLARYGGEVHGSKTGAMGPVLGGLLFSREYTLADRLNYFRGIFGSMKLLWPQLMKVDLCRSVPELKVPVFFMEGRWDRECPSPLAAKYFDALEAPAKELVWFERSAHMPNLEERDAFNRVLAEKVLPIALGADATHPQKAHSQPLEPLL